VKRTGGQGAKRVAETTRRPTTRTSTRRPPAAVQPWRGGILLLAKALVITSLVLASACGLFYARLLHGPVPLGFLVEPLQRAIAEELAGFGVEIDNVAARLNDRHQLEFELSNVRIADSSNVPLAVAPSATFSISHRALLQGRIAPESVDLISPRLLLYLSEDGKVSLQFSAPNEAVELDRHKGVGSDSQGKAMASANAAGLSDGSLGRIDLVKMLSEASARARRREYATAYLREVGLRSATLIVDNGSRKSIWRLPELDIDLDHRRSRSSIAGRAKVESLAGPWSLNFRTFEAEKAGTLQLAVSVQNLVPRGLARTLPHLAALEGFDLPVWGEAFLDLSSDGDILGGRIGIDAAPGTVALPWLADTAFAIDGGHLEISYQSGTRRFEIAPSVLVWGDSRVQFAGSVSHDARAPEGPAWAFALKSEGGWIGAELPAHERLPIDDWSAHGFLAPERGRVLLSQFLLRAGGAEVTAEGDVAGMGSQPSARLEGKIGAMPEKTFKALWPAALAPQSRAWIGQRLVRGQLQGGSFKLTSGEEPQGGERTSRQSAADRVSLTLVASDLALALSDRWPALELPRALARLDGHTFEISVPEGAFVASDGRRIGVKGNFSVDMQEPLPRTGHITAKAQGPVSLALEMLAQEPFNALEHSGLNPATVDGKLEAQLSLALPLQHEMAFADLKIDGKARISDGRVPQVFPPYDVTGANIVLELTGTAVEARGDMLIKGVPIKANWQHVFGVPQDKQPPLTLTANLDANDRNQLGLDINDIVQGEVAAEITVTRDAQNEQRVHLRADLANAELSLDSIAWKKPKGRSSTFQCDIVKNGATHPVELMNVQLVGDNVAVEGWMGVGADHRVREYRFPNFSINVITSLQAHGKMRADGVWEVTAKGPRYDGRDLFQSFFDVVGGFERDGRVRPGIDLRAEIDTVVGFNDSALRNVKVWLQRRNNKLTALDARGVLDGNKAFSAVVRPDSAQPRQLRAEANDAGQLFKLVGFYSSAVGGSMNLEVNLDGAGLAQRTGTLWAKNFVLLGDAVGGDLLVLGPDGAPRPIGDKRGVVREQFSFETLSVPFSVGHGQFLLNEARIEGPILSANMRGKLDFRSQNVNVGGTFTPLAGLNTMFRGLPLFGPLLTGPRGDGVFAMTFAIHGTMSAPQVIVNPLSVITPGVTREIMQMAPDTQRIVPRDRPQSRGEAAPRPSSAPVGASGSNGFEARVQPEIGGGWSADGEPTTPAKKR
jgi:AsmA-like C-terminal region/Protein of unknown function